MAIKIRSNTDTKGLTVEKQEFKFCQLAGDTTIFVKDLHLIVNLVTLLSKFYKCSGLKLNMEKTEVVPIGTSRYKDITLPYSIRKIRVNCDSFKTLGVWYSQDQNEAVR